jgi:hypothetical protein
MLFMGACLEPPNLAVVVRFVINRLRFTVFLSLVKTTLSHFLV